MGQINKIEKIDLYLRGELKGDELLDFENQLKVDKQLSSQLSSIQNAMLAIQIQGDIELKNRLNDIHETIKPGTGFLTQIFLK